MITYPNIELIVYKTRQLLLKDDSFLKAMAIETRKGGNVNEMFDVIVFPQIWGNTCTGFDICNDGSPAIGGCAMTKEYTTIVHETMTDYYCIFFGERPCYTVSKPTKEFYEDLANRYMVSLSVAKERY